MSYSSMSQQTQEFFKNTAAVKAANLTTGKKIFVGLTDAGLLSVALEDHHLIQPGNLIKVPNGDILYISDSGQCQSTGLQTFPAPRVRYFANLYRYDTESTDSFGRPPAEPQLVKEDIPLCSYQGVFYASSQAGIKQGDILGIEDGDYIVLGKQFSNVHTLRLSTKRQH